MLRAARCSSRGSSVMASSGTVMWVGESVLRAVRRRGMPRACRRGRFRAGLQGFLGGWQDVGVSVGS
jgi:hypothetical protein